MVYQDLIKATAVNTTPVPLAPRRSQTPMSHIIRFRNCFFCNARSFLSKSSSYVARGLDCREKDSPGPAGAVWRRGVRGGITIAKGRLTKCCRPCSNAGRKYVPMNDVNNKSMVNRAKKPDERKYDSDSFVSEVG